MPLPRLRLLLLLLTVLSLTVSLPVHAADEKRLTLDEALGYAGAIDQYGAIPRLRWLKPAKPTDTPALLETRFEASGASLYRVDARTGAATPFYSAILMESALIPLPGMDPETAKKAARNVSGFRFAPSDKRILLTVDGDLIAYDFLTNRAARVTDNAKERREEVSLSPNGSHVAFVVDNDLYIADVNYDNGAPTPPRRVTKDGSATVFNARLDWVYEEELYGRGTTTGYKWSEDGSRLAFLRLDDAEVPMIPLVDDMARIPTVQQLPYPKAGDPNPRARLGVVSVRGVTDPVWVNLDEYPEADRLIVRFGFTPNANRLSLQVQNRTQTFLHLLTADVATGKTTRALSETSPAWVDILDEPRYLADGSFLWRSARTGFRHLYQYDRNNALIGAVTSGEWDVLEVLSVSERPGSVYFASNKTGATQTQVFVAKLRGGSGDAPARLTLRDGSHSADFDSTNAYFLDRWNDLDDPTQLRLHAAFSGVEVRPLGANLLPITTRRGYKLSTPELVTIKARDGYALDALLLKPADFSPTKKYPVIYCLYGGPGNPTVVDRWGTVSLWHQFLAQQGCLVFMCDNRSASSKGLANVWSVHKRLGESETRDIEDAIGYLKTLPYADTKRVGVYGWSYGGFMVEYLMTHTDLFAAGVAGAGVADWKLYDTIYTERYMDTPQANAAGYAGSSPIGAAGKLSGKLLLLHGTLDDNVHVQITRQFAFALERPGIQPQGELLERPL
ncbi:MAG: S9 family peptidase, partial [Armatimonadetes bacterium]|nr:S9 family peptidase [Armatimonadota bacterium]